MQKPNTVLVGKKFLVNGTATQTVGDIVVANAETGAFIDTTTSIATTINTIKIGLVKSDSTITYSAPISRKGIENMVITEGVAATEAVSVIDFTSVTGITVGHRYVLRVIYKDLYEHPGQFTHSYEVIATSTDLDVLGAAFAARIAAHSGARVTAAYVASTDHELTLTAKNLTANGFGTQGKEAITPYSQVRMTVVAYVTNPSSFLTSSQDAITGLVITTTDSTPGKGNAYIVRDREQAALAYKGITYRTEWPTIKPELNVVLTSLYDTLVIESKTKYQSPDNQYVKETQMATEVYIVDGATATAATLADKIAAWRA